MQALQFNINHFSMSLYLGNEIFEVSTQRVVEHNHIFVRQGAGLQGQAVFKNRLVFRPISTDTLTHKKMTLTMAEKTNKAQKVRVLADVGLNPEQTKAVRFLYNFKLRNLGARSKRRRKIACG